MIQKGKNKFNLKNILQKNKFISSIICTFAMIFLSSVSINAAENGTSTGNFMVWFLCAIAFLKVSQKLDSLLSALGLNVGNTGGSMIAEMLIAAKTISSIKGHGINSNSSNSSDTLSESKGFMSGGFSNSIGRKIENGAIGSITNKKNNGISEIGKMAYENSLSKGGDFANSIIGAVAKGDISKMGSIKGENAIKAFDSYINSQNNIKEDTPISDNNSSSNISHISDDSKIPIESKLADNITSNSAIVAPESTNIPNEATIADELTSSQHSISPNSEYDLKDSFDDCNTNSDNNLPSLNNIDNNDILMQDLVSNILPLNNKPSDDFQSSKNHANSDSLLNQDGNSANIENIPKQVKTDTNPISLNSDTNSVSESIPISNNNIDMKNNPEQITPVINSLDSNLNMQNTSKINSNNDIQNNSEQGNSNSDFISSNSNLGLQNITDSTKNNVEKTIPSSNISALNNNNIGVQNNPEQIKSSISSIDSNLNSNSILQNTTESNTNTDVKDNPKQIESNINSIDLSSNIQDIPTSNSNLEDTENSTQTDDMNSNFTDLNNNSSNENIPMEMNQAESIISDDNGNNGNTDYRVSQLENYSSDNQSNYTDSLNAQAQADIPVTYSDIEIGGGRITGTEKNSEYPQGIRFAMYDSDKYIEPKDTYSMQTSADGSKWYKQYAIDSVEKKPYMDSNGKIKYKESIIKKLPNVPQRKERI